MNKLELLKDEIKKLAQSNIKITNNENDYTLNINSIEIVISKINNFTIETTELKDK